MSDTPVQPAQRKIKEDSEPMETNVTTPACGGILGTLLLLSVVLASFVAACSNGTVSKSANAPTASAPKLPAPPPAPPIHTIPLPALDEELHLMCKGTFTEFTGPRENYPAKVTLSNFHNATGTGTDGRPKRNGLVFKIDGVNDANLMGTVIVDNDGGDFTVVNSSDSRKWDITESYSGGSRHPEDDSRDHVLLDATTGHLEFVNERHPTNSGGTELTSTTTFVARDKYVGECQAENSGAMHDRKEAEAQREVQSNPRLAIVRQLTFNAGPACNALKSQLIQFARQPFISEPAWDDFYDRVTSTAVRTNCLAQ